MSTIIMSQCWPMGGMTAAQKAVLISLADQANDDGVCWPSVGTISKRTCLSERAVQNAVKWLISVGLLASKERAGTSSVYRITPAAYAPPQEMHPASDAPHPRTGCTPPPQEVRTTPAPDAPKPSLNHQGNRKDPKPKAPSSSFVLPDWINQVHWDAWHSCEKRRKATDAQKQLAVEKLAKWRDQGIDYAKALEDAAISGWQGLFEPKPAAMTPNRQANTHKHAAAAATIYEGVWDA